MINLAISKSIKDMKTLSQFIDLLLENNESLDNAFYMGGLTLRKDETEEATAWFELSKDDGEVYLYEAEGLTNEEEILVHQLCDYLTQEVEKKEVFYRNQRATEEYLVTASRNW